MSPQRLPGTDAHRQAATVVGGRRRLLFLYGDPKHGCGVVDEVRDAVLRPDPLEQLGWHCHLVNGWSDPDVVVACLAPGNRYDLVVLHVDRFVNPVVASNCRRYKIRYPEARVVACGFLPTVRMDRFRDEFPFIDNVIVGGWRDRLLQMCGCDATEGLGDGADNAGPWQWDCRLAIRRDGGGEVASITTSDGCPYRCAFCRISTYTDHGSWGRYRVAAMPDVARELEKFAQSGGTCVRIRDVNFLGTLAAGRRRARQFRDCLRTRGLAFRSQINARSDALAPDTVAVLREAGVVHVNIGLESMVQAQLDRLEKRQSPAQNRMALAALAEQGVDCQVYVMLTDPWSTVPELAKNLDRLIEIADKFLIKPVLKVRAFAGTPLHRRLARSRMLVDAEPGLAYSDYVYADAEFGQRIEEMERRFEAYYHRCEELVTVAADHREAGRAEAQRLLIDIRALVERADAGCP